VTVGASCILWALLPLLQTCALIVYPALSIGGPNCLALTLLPREFGNGDVREIATFSFLSYVERTARIIGL
jgi:hypothetical protein